VKKYKIGFIGTGGRSVRYAEHYATRPDMEIVAIADPNAHNRRAFCELSGIRNDVEQFDDWQDMHRLRQDLDAVAICSPNHVHMEQAVPFLEGGLPVLLEKPIAINAADCDRLLAAERHNGGRAVIGFVLRSTPFYRAIHETLQKGRIGTLYAIQADELIGWGVSSIINRNEYKRFRATYGSLILSKCCHDVDILNWMVGARPIAVHSFGRSNVFQPDPSLPETCDGCSRAADCKYFMEPTLTAGENPGDAVNFQFMRTNNRCIYNIDKDIIDTQVVSLEYENGVVANFTLALNCVGPRTGRNFHAIGTEGRVWGEFSEELIRVVDNQSEQVQEISCQSDGSGHGGGDRSLALELLAMLADPDHRPLHSMQAGYDSAMACMAADLSRNEGRRVNIDWQADGSARLH
jgi:predicted dehydrogenase